MDIARIPVRKWIDKVRWVHESGMGVFGADLGAPGPVAEQLAPDGQRPGTP